jgi:amino acid adenylation domain-containing protein
MTTLELLNRLRSLGVKIWADGDLLCCNAPLGMLEPTLRTELSLKKAEILMLLRKTSTDPRYITQPITPISRDNQPLSFAQQRLWFLSQMQPESPSYNIPGAVRLTGTLNEIALEHTLKEVIRRHEALRTTFPSVNGQPVQTILEEEDSKLMVVCLDGLLEAKRFIDKEAHRPFDLTKNQLIRSTLLHLGEEDYILMLTMHHIICDGWSLGVLFRELVVLYKAFTVGKPSLLPELPIQYADFAYWQRQWLQGEVLETQLSYWKQQLAGEVPVLELPTDRPRPPIQRSRGAVQTFMLPKVLTKALKALSQQENVTLFMTLLAAFKVLLYRYTGQNDIVVGSPIANRNRSEIEGLIGFFVNTLVMRTDLSGNPTFRKLLARVRKVTLDAYAHQDLPFEKLVEELQPERDMSRTPIFQVVFVLQNAPTETLNFSGTTLTWLNADSGATRFDLEIHLTEVPEGLSIYVMYNTDLFDGTTIVRLFGHFQNLLEGIVINSEQRLSDLPLLIDSEQHQLLVEWNNTQADYPANKCIHQLFEEQVEKTPDAVAIVFEDQQLTYGQLNERSNQLAHYLRSLGVGPEVLVGICVERSLEMIVGLLGILKAGGAYVPLDPAYPKKRLTFMLENTRAAVLLTQERLLEQLPDYATRMVCLDRDWQMIAHESTENPVSNVSVQNVVYVIHTSGSTGKPKGVLVTHYNVIRLFSATEPWFHFNEFDVWTFFHSYAFDFSVWELWGSLLYGGRLVVVAFFVSRSPEVFYDLVCTEQVTILNQTPSAFNQFVYSQGGEQNGTEKLRLVIFGGEALDIQSLKPWFSCHDEQHPQLVNMYGITETTVHVTYRPLMITDLDSAGSMIGTPIPDIQVYILDRHLQPVPVGVPGEMYVGGGGLSHGYLNSPAITGSRFIPNPFSNESGARLYKTGDLVRFRTNGDIEYLGRIDNQVKIRGFRIELGEIEATMVQHPAVQEAVVLARKDELDNGRLLGYVVPDLQYNTTKSNVELLQAEQIELWQSTYEEVYGNSSSCADSTFNVIGWNSSYTNQPIPAEEMREWRDNTVTQILAMKPRRILEIGCGTGLLLFPIAPYCEKYWGTDFSPEALKLVRKEVEKQSLGHVKLLERQADNFEEIETQSFDTVIINSVVQYFPDIEYLSKVLKKAVKAVVPGGCIFIGDVRNLALLEMLHLSVELYKSPPELSITKLQWLVHSQTEQEEELLIEPTFFAMLKKSFPRVSQVQIRLKQSKYQNELTKFRYDVVLHIEKDETNLSVVNDWLDWQEENLTLSKLRQLLIKTKPEILGLKRIPNLRLLADAQVLELLSKDEEFKTAGQLMKTASETLPDIGIEPDVLRTIVKDMGYIAEISWSASGTKGCYYDVGLTRCRRSECSDTLMPLIVWERNRCSSEVYANNPLRTKVKRKLLTELRSYLLEKLPDYMVPSTFVILEEIPLTPNGKIDRKALPEPDNKRPELDRAFVAPRTPVEDILTSIWSEILGIKQIGIYDNFFDLGGHSLMATQVISRLCKVFRVKLPLRTLFEMPTINDLASTIIKTSGKPEVIEKIAQTLKELEELSENEVEMMLSK